MRRNRGSETSQGMPGEDSFLDIIANIVGILILLVMIVGVRAAMNGREAAKEATDPNRSTAIDTPENLVSADELDRLRRQVRLETSEAADVLKRLAHSRESNKMRAAERELLATYVADFEQQIADRRDKLDKAKQQDFDLRRDLAEAQQELEELTRRQLALLAQAPERAELKDMPTSLSRVVTEDEIAVRIKDGRVSVVPMDELRDLFLELDKSRLVGLAGHADGYGTVGPVDGFRLHYRMRRLHVETSSGMILSRPDVAFEYRSAAGYVGETIEQALAEGSQFWAKINQRNPRRTVVTFWVYPDSFGDFQKMKVAVRERNFATAARPLPHGVEIASSSTGTATSAH